MADSIQRQQIADYLNTGTSAVPVWSLMGVGYDTLDENPNAQKSSKTYICDASASTTIKGYDTTFPFNSDLIKSETSIMALYDIGRNQRTGGAAEKDYVRVELFEPTGQPNTFKARKFRVSVEVSGLSGKGGENIQVSGNLNNVGSFIDGTFNVQSKIFTPAILQALTVLSAAGSTSGTTKVTVSPVLVSGNSYVYKTAATVALPAYNDVLTTGWTAWDGTADITAATANEIVIAEINGSSICYGAGKIAVTSKV